MFLKRKERAKIKAKGCTEGHYNQKFKHKLEPRSHIKASCVHVSSYMTNAMDSNYKLRSVIGQGNKFTANKWT